MVPTAKYTLKPQPDRERFKRALLALGGCAWTEKPEQYCDYRLDGQASTGWLRAKQFSNGTLYLEASTDGLLAQMTDLLGGHAPASPPASSTRSVQPSLLGATATGSSRSGSGKPSGLLNVTGTYIGTDESGKGDYFGPLVIAGVLVTDQTVPVLIELGVMDSKKLTDQKIGGLYRDIISVVGEKALNVVEIGPAKYNELYDRFKRSGRNLNHLLAWGHATVIENLAVRFPECTQVIADQFGNERYIQSQLKEKGRGVALYQTHRAEANVGVAAASIVARYRFVQKLRQLSTQYDIVLPLGASALVKQRAKEFVRQHGRDTLGQVAKLHFKTTQELG